MQPGETIPPAAVVIVDPTNGRDLTEDADLRCRICVDEEVELAVLVVDDDERSFRDIHVCGKPRWYADGQEVTLNAADSTSAGHEILTAFYERYPQQ